MSEITDEMLRGIIADEYAKAGYKDFITQDIRSGANPVPCVVAALRGAIALAATQPPKSIDRDSVLEEAAKACDLMRTEFASPEYAVGQPWSSFSERFACNSCATAIRALKETP